MQVLRDVLDAHEVLPDAQYDDDDIGYAVPELCRTDKPAAASSNQLFCKGGRECCWREFVLVLYSYNLLRLVKLILRDTRKSIMRDTMKSIISNCITNTIYCRVPVRQEII